MDNFVCQEVSHRPPTDAVRFRSQVILCEICGGQSATSSISSVECYSTGCPIFIYHFIIDAVWSRYWKSLQNSNFVTHITRSFDTSKAKALHRVRLSVTPTKFPHSAADLLFDSFQYRALPSSQSCKLPHSKNYCDYNIQIDPYIFHLSFESKPW